MKDAVILTKDKSLFTVIAFELEGMGLTVGDGSENECSLLIADIDSIEKISVKYKSSPWFRENRARKNAIYH